ncbi:hypothetical protein CDL15_Pgr005702 [Punica granatum]|uniref:Zinc finger CCCH domain-containing protein 41 n=1 Tax=Punica granatum TaxID=22663 RepID=A0A218WFC8_PUNGR|nr:hypothetical protein CDL15_Pgr005702 [Punica granatum]PKI79173.1 hypothetical protein CRG98_000465 [Punica granatum]
MVLKISSPKSGNLSASDYASDPEKEISDDDDDDRNHKHRRRETRSQSSDKDAVENISARPYRKQNRSFENGHAFRESGSQTSQSWNNSAPSEKHFPGKFGKRPFESNQRNRANQTYLGEVGVGRGRGRDSGAWNHRNNRFKSLDLASQMVPRGTIPPGLFPERGLPSIPNAQGASWGGYGLIPSGGIDAIHSIGLQGAFRPAISSSLGIPRQRCRDFEERGFCLRGDMCPMEHGINRIVVEDVQSLSQFNLPVSLSSGSILGAPAIPGPLPSVGAASTSMLNSKGTHSRNGKHGVADDVVFKSAYSEPANAAGADLYDPDQPLWNNNGPETSSALVALRSSPVDEAVSLSNGDASENQMNEAAAFERQDRTALPVGSQSTSSSIWGRIGSSKGKTSMRMGTSDNGRNEVAGNQEALGNGPGNSNRGKKVMAEDADPKALDSSRAQSDTMRLTRKPTQKALRTLFVNGIPQKNNRRDALLAHFQKFGKVIDIYIPTNSERAFVQFSKREEAEAALKAPDAVMGNRFIKLWWANRDSIVDDGINGVAGVSSTPRGATSSSIPTALSIPSRGKDNIQPAAPKAGDVPSRDTSASHGDQSKLPAASSPKVPSPLQKKLELEQLKEELRKKQEMLDRKRSDFKRQLDKLAKQATGVKDEDVAEQISKRQKVELASDPNKAATPRSDSAVPTPRPSDADNIATSCEDKMDNKTKLPDNIVPGKSDANSIMGSQESSLKRHSRPLAHLAMPFSPNRYKLDNRPATFRILPPLPPGLANVAALKEHFSSYGDLTVVELEDTEAHGDPNRSETVKSCCARVGFRDRQTAERAFLNCKSWEGHYLQFVWLASTPHAKATTNPGGSENSSSATKEPLDSDIQSVDKAAPTSSEEPVNGEFEHSERETSDDRAEPTEVSQSVPTSASGEEVD